MTDLPNVDTTARRERLMALRLVGMMTNLAVTAPGVRMGRMPPMAAQRKQALLPQYADQVPVITIYEDALTAIHHLKAKDAIEEANDRKAIDDCAVEIERTHLLSASLASKRRWQPTQTILFAGLDYPRFVAADIGGLVHLFGDLQDREVLLPQIDGVKQVISFMEQARRVFPASGYSIALAARVRATCERHGLFASKGATAT